MSNKEEKKLSMLNTYASPPPRRPAVRTFPWFKISQKESAGAVCAAVGCAVRCAVGFAVGALEGLRVGLRVGLFVGVALFGAVTASPT